MAELSEVPLHALTTIINTRPRERAAQLTSALHSYGYTVLELPLLQIEPLPLDDVLIQQFRHLSQMDLIVAVSSSAVQLGIDYYLKLGLSLDDLKHKKWLAIGANTQRSLARYGIDALCPTVESSEGALQLPLLRDCQQQRVAFWRGIGGRVVLMEQLAEQGCQVTNMQLYRRTAPQPAATVLHALQQLTAAWVIISSEYSLRQWQRIRPQGGIFNYLVLGERVTQLAHIALASYHVPNVIICLDNLSAAHIHQTIIKYINSSLSPSGA